MGGRSESHTPARDCHLARRRSRECAQGAVLLWGLAETDVHRDGLVRSTVRVSAPGAADVNGDLLKYRRRKRHR